MSADDVVILDATTTLGIFRVGVQEAESSFTPFPDVPPALVELSGGGARLGILAEDACVSSVVVRKTLDEAGLLGLFDENLILSLSIADLPLVLRQPHPTHGDGARWLLVSEDAVARVKARRAGALTAPHVVFAADVLSGAEALYHVALSPPGGADDSWRDALAGERIVPFRVEEGDGGAPPLVLAIAGTAATTRLQHGGWRVNRLGAADEPQTTDLYALTTTAADPHASFVTAEEGCEPLEESGGRVLTSSPGELVVAVPAGRSPREFCLPIAQHDLGARLIPTRSLLDDPRDRILPGSPAAHEVDAATRKILKAHVRSGAINRFVRRYAGKDRLDASGRIDSRHVLHPDNRRVLDALRRDFAAIGGAAFRIKLRPFPYKDGCANNLEIRMPGSLAGVVIVSAHLDSTAALSQPYIPEVDRAPGADDDGSGMAAVYCIAAAFHDLAKKSGKAHRELRFVFFNAEEDFLAGSMFYAAEEARAQSPIAGVFHMDMIGYDSERPRTFEVHAGRGNTTVIDNASNALAAQVRDAAEELFAPARLSAQLYPVRSAPGDPASATSDHHSFHLMHLPACLVIEDYFAGPLNQSPPEEPNPHWHHRCDVELNPGYASDIALAVAVAAWARATT